METLSQEDLERIADTVREALKTSPRYFARPLRTSAFIGEVIDTETGAVVAKFYDASHLGGLDAARTLARVLNRGDV